ncbi:MAG: twin-arginine translocase TatA/TatE family subunit [Candidatus Shapirobacteria bacterium]|jgi:sec-independent protein translocase protein TatA
MFNNIGLTEILIVAAIILLIFGGKKLPEFARGITGAITEFKKAVKDNPKKEDK